MTMEKIFWFSAILGGALVLITFVTLLLGLGGDEGGGDGGDAGGVDGDAGVDASGEANVDGDSADSSDSSEMHNGFNFLRAFSIRSLSAGFAFFGLAGLTARSMGFSPEATLGIAILCGVIAIYLVYRLMRMLSTFNANGALNDKEVVGAEGTVYLSIPGGRKGIGKVTVLQQERSVEYEAVTDEDETLTAGKPIVVVKRLGGGLVLVEKRRG